MQVKKSESVCRKTETQKKLFAAAAAYKKMFPCENFQTPPRQKINGPSLNGNLE